MFSGSANERIYFGTCNTYFHKAIKMSKLRSNLPKQALEKLILFYVVGTQKNHLNDGYFEHPILIVNTMGKKI